MTLYQPAAASTHTASTMARAVALLLVFGAACASAYPMIWTSMTKDCSAVPLASYGPHGAPVQDSKTQMVIKRNGGAVVKVCPGVVHEIKAAFPEARQYMLTTSQGVFSGSAPECPQRSFSQVAKPEMAAELVVPCDATGAVTLALTSVGARATDRTYQAISTTLPVKELVHCPASPCHAAKAGGGAPQQQQQQLKLENGALPADVTLDASVLQGGSVNVGDLLARLGVTEEQLKALQASQATDAAGAALPAPDAAGAAPGGTPKTVQVGMGDLLNPLKRLFGQQGQQAAGGERKEGVNPIKFLQTVANLMPKDGAGAGAGGADGATAGQGQGPNALKVLNNLAALVAPKDGEKGAAAGGAPILNLLQTVGGAINGSPAAAKDGAPVLNVLQTLGAMGKDGGAPMLEVVKSLGALMPNGEGSGAGPNMHNLMAFMNAVSKATGGLDAAAGGAAAGAGGPKDIPGAAIAVLKSMAPLLPKDGVAQPPNWPAMMQFVRASGNLMQLLRPAAAAVGAPHED